MSDLLNVSSGPHVRSKYTTSKIMGLVLLALLPAALLCLGGYYLYESLIFSNFISPLYGLLGNLMQAIFSSILFAAAGLAFDKAGIKSRLSII